MLVGDCLNEFSFLYKNPTSTYLKMFHLNIVYFIHNVFVFKINYK